MGNRIIIDNRKAKIIGLNGVGKVGQRLDNRKFRIIEGLIIEVLLFLLFRDCFFVCLSICFVSRIMQVLLVGSS